MKRTYLIGVDMGATNLRAGLIKDDEIVCMKNVKINKTGSADTIVDQIVECINKVKVDETQSIGIGVPSVVDVNKGIVYNVINIPSWNKVHLKKILENRFEIPVFVNNDSNCFAIGEKYYGKGQRYKSLIGVTIGSGLGSGTILDGKLYCGPNSGAGEIGMVPYKDSILEHYSSGQFFGKFHNTSGKKVFKCAQKSDKEALRIYEEFGVHLGNAMKVLMYMYDPEIIVLGGSISRAYEYFKESMFKEIETFAYDESLSKLSITISEREHIALLGAAALALDGQKHI